jgi:hypothetical protein
MDEFLSLVIRGICDSADSHKNKRWQFYGGKRVWECRPLPHRMSLEFELVYSYAVWAALFSMYMLSLQVALGILDVWMARFGRKPRLGQAAANLQWCKELFCTCRHLPAVDRNSGSDEKTSGWSGVYMN